MRKWRLGTESIASVFSVCDRLRGWQSVFIKTKPISCKRLLFEPVGLSLGALAGAGFPVSGCSRRVRQWRLPTESFHQFPQYAIGSAGGKSFFSETKPISCKCLSFDSLRLSLGDHDGTDLCDVSRLGAHVVLSDFRVAHLIRMARSAGGYVAGSQGRKSGKGLSPKTGRVRAWSMEDTNSLHIRSFVEHPDDYAREAFT